MAKVATVGSKLDDPEGVITEGLSWCRVNGKPITYVGATGTTHGGFSASGLTWGPDGDNLGGPWIPDDPEDGWYYNDPGHEAGTWWITTGSSFFKAGGRRVAVVGSATSCGHFVATGEFADVGGPIV